jgi:hypothetical protein
LDLIALDSPFLSESELPNEDVVSEIYDIDPKHQFNRVWNTKGSADSRGWCETRLEGIVRDVQGLADTEVVVISADQEPFPGDSPRILSLTVLFQNCLI